MKRAEALELVKEVIEELSMDTLEEELADLVLWAYDKGFEEGLEHYFANNPDA